MASQSIKRTYIPLQDPDKELRLLKLEPGEEGAQIRGTMSVWNISDIAQLCPYHKITYTDHTSGDTQEDISRTYELSLGEVFCDARSERRYQDSPTKLPLYKAISYAWGSKESLQEIEIDGQTWTVYDNCFYALWQVRSHFPEWYVWVDQICIDQYNEIEKSKQVNAMANIYSTADQVIASIGRHDEDSRVIYKFCGIVDFEYGSQEEAILCTYAGLHQSTVAGYASVATDGQNILQYWQSFTKRPYFARLWVIQEMYIGQVRGALLLCGESVTTISHLREVRYSIMKMCGLSAMTTEPFDRFQQFTQEPRRPRLQKFIEEVRHLQCTNPCDRIYGCLAVIDWDGKPAPVPDYAMSGAELAMKIMPLLRLEDGHDGYHFLEYIMFLVEALELTPADIHRFFEGTRSTISWRLHSNGCVPIAEDGRERLICPLVDDRARSMAQLPHTFHAREESEGYRRSLTVYTNTIPSAEVPCNTIAGDIMVWIHSDCPILVVLRPSSTWEVFTIIGPATLFEGFSIPGFDPRGFAEWLGFTSEMSLSEQELLRLAINLRSDTYTGLPPITLQSMNHANTIARLRDHTRRVVRETKRQEGSHMNTSHEPTGTTDLWTAERWSRAAIFLPVSVHRRLE